MKPSVYIETTIPSYLTAWRSPELVMAANQEATRKWWDESRIRFELFISELVIGEAGRPAGARTDGPSRDTSSKIAARSRPATKGEGGCVAYSSCDRSRYGLSVDVELHAHRQRDYASKD